MWWNPGTNGVLAQVAAQIASEELHEPERGGARAQATGLELADVYAEHHDFVWRNVQRLGVPDHSVEDAVHDVFLVVSRRLAQFEGRSSIRTWLFAIAMRVVQHHHRARQRHDRRARALAGEPEHAQRDGYERSDAARLLHALLAELDEPKRAVFIMAELEEMTAPEIAVTLGVKVPTVYSRLRAARLELQAAARQRESS